MNVKDYPLNKLIDYLNEYRGRLNQAMTGDKRTTGKWHGFIKQRLRYLRDKREEQLELWITLTINCENY